MASTMELSDKVNGLSPQEIKTVLGGITEFLEVKTEPFEISEETLKDCYSALELAADYHGSLPVAEREEHQQDNLKVLEIIEFQASWHVLRKFFDDEIIERLDAEGRKDKYLRYLYSFAENFDFFEEREMTLEKLSMAGFIGIKDYRIEKPLRN